jgi:hypothetical protein
LKLIVVPRLILFLRQLILGIFRSLQPLAIFQQVRSCSIQSSITIYKSNKGAVVVSQAAFPFVCAQTKKAAPTKVGGKPQLQTSTSIKSVPVIGPVETITVLYASTQGTSRAFADRLARGLQESDLGELEKSPNIRVSRVDHRFH